MLRVKSDDGAVAVVAAVVVSFLVLPLLMFVIDVGGMYVERRQLQHSADSAATAVAQACKDNKPQCDVDTALAYADTFANPNDKRGVTVVKVCGNYANPQDDTQYLDDCGSYPLSDTVKQYGYKYWCDEPPSDTTIQYVEVHIESAPGWATQISGSDGKINACGRALVNPAKVIWTTPAPSISPGVPGYVETIPGTPPTVIHHPGSGNPGVGNVLAVTMSVCDWQNSTNNGARYNVTTTIQFPTTNTTCSRVQTGAINSSANGGLDAAKNNGSSGPNQGLETVTLGDGKFTDPGNTSAWNGIGYALANHPRTQVWLIPLYDKSGGTNKQGGCMYGSSGSGSNVCYHIIGFAAFVVASYNLGSSYKGGPDANSLTRAFKGYFTTYVCSNTTECSGNGGNFGVTDPPWDETIPGTPDTYVTHPPTPDATTTFAPTPSTSPGTAHNIP